MYCNEKKTFIGTLPSYYALYCSDTVFMQVSVVKALKLTCIVSCPLTGGYFRPCRPQIRVHIRLREVSAYGRLKM